MCEKHGTSHALKSLPTYVPIKFTRCTYEEEPRTLWEQAGSVHREAREICYMVRKSRCFSIPRRFSAKADTVVSVKALTASACALSCCRFSGNRRDPAGDVLHKFNIVAVASTPSVTLTTRAHRKIVRAFLKGGVILASTSKSENEGGIGNVLYSLRIIEKLSVKELAERMGVKPTYICDVEANRKRPSLDKLEEFSTALGIDCSALIYFNEQGKKCRYNHKQLLLGILQEMTSVNT